jgi:hypothetical protein
MEAISSGSVLEMVDSSSPALLSELNSKRSRMLLWPFVALLFALLVVAIIAAEVASWLVVTLAILPLIPVFLAYHFDQLNKSVVIFYDLDPQLTASFERLHDNALQIGRCAAAWQIDSRVKVYDPKYHAGAGQLITRRQISVNVSSPPFVRTNVPTVSLRLSGLTLYFFPDRALVFSTSGIGAISYDDLSVVVNESRFIEEGWLPHDAKVIGSTWRYVNKNGGPDRRFNDNREIPVCLYEELWFNAPSGLNELVQVSRTGAGQGISDAIQAMADVIARVGVASPPTSRPLPILGVTDAMPSSRPSARSARIQGDLSNSFLNARCCVMCSDGRASRSEKSCIRTLMTEAGVLWDENETDLRIASFIDRIGREGYRRVLAATLQEMPKFKEEGAGELVAESLQRLVHADGQATDRELQLCAHIRA